MLAELAAVLVPVFFCIALGYGWERLTTRPFDTDLIVRLVANIATPALILSALLEADLEPAVLAKMGLGALGMMVFCALIGATAIRLAGKSQSVYLPLLVFPNAGNLGLPICLFAFGDRGLALAIGFFTVTTIAHFTAGVALISGRFSFRELTRTPVVYAVSLALIWLLLEWPVPRWFANTTRLVGYPAIPLSLITLGVSLARLKAGALGRATVVSIGRLGLGVIAGIVLAWAFGFEGAERGVLILESATPVAVFNYLFAQYYHREPEEVAGAVLVSTLLSLLSLPALLIWLL